MEETTKNNQKLQGGITGKGFVKGDPRINREGRKADTPEQKLEKKAKKEFIKEYIKGLREALPVISPILITKAIEGDMQAIKEINDRVLGKPIQKQEIKAEIKLPTPIIPLNNEI